ncbi:MAG: hypothetical protein HW416_3475 [Chloroflexi bacterium]|nr:hypothetical protein [Chloroflexota bacterium]
MIDEFDHSAIAVYDLDLAEHFYAKVMGEILETTFDYRSPASTDQIMQRIKTLLEGRASRGSEQVYGGAMPHSSVTVGQAIIPLSLYQSHYQEPPPEQLRGVPRLALHVTPEQMDRAVEVFGRHKVAFEGPIDHPAESVIARSIYTKDPSSNFIELCCPRA